MKVNELIEAEERVEQTKTDLLQWQARIIDCLPDNFDVKLKLSDVSYHKPGTGLIVVERNGKELFSLSSYRASIPYYGDLHIHGEYFYEGVSISASNLQADIDRLLAAIELRRKLINLLSAKIIIQQGDKASGFVFILRIYKAWTGFNDWIRVKMKQPFEISKVAAGLLAPTYGTSKHTASTVDKAIEAIEKIYKTLPDK